MVHIFQASTTAEISSARLLFQEYADWLKVDLCFQGFAAELEGLPGLYAPERGRLLLARLEAEAGGSDSGSSGFDQIAGCVALRPLDARVCEMKRLYVRPPFRGEGIGRSLAAKVIQEARTIGYKVMRLDTLPSMPAAIGLYAALGFVRCEAYYETPLTETIFMERPLAP